MPGTLILSSVQHMAAFGVLDLLPHQPRHNNVLWITPPKPFKFFFLVIKNIILITLTYFVCAQTCRGACVEVIGQFLKLALFHHEDVH